MDGRVLTSGNKTEKKVSVLQANENNKNLVLDASNSPASGRHVFFAEEFKRIMTTYQQAYLSERINMAIIRNSIPESDGRIFYLYWTDKELHTHALKVAFEVNDKYSSGNSKFITQMNFNDLLPGYLNAVKHSKNNFCSIKVFKIGGKPARQSDNRYSYQFDEIELMAIWFTMDSFVGELRTLQDNRIFSADEVMKIYNYFSEFLCIENVFICDDSVISNEEDDASVPLRLISALATGKTWYQENVRSLQLFECRQFPLTSHEALKQNAAGRTCVLEELRTLTLDKWNDMLNLDRQKQLMTLYQEFMQKRVSSSSFFRASNAKKEKVSEFGTDTIGALVSLIYSDAKKQNTATVALRSISELLCGNISMQFGSVPVNRKDTDSWVKERVHQLMWGSVIWSHQSNPIARGISFK